VQVYSGQTIALMEDTPKALRNMKIPRRKKSIFYVQVGNTGVQTPFIRAHAVTGTGTGHPQLIFRGVCRNRRQLRYVS
jgi:hypothetical protein